MCDLSVNIYSSSVDTVSTVVHCHNKIKTGRCVGVFVLVVLIGPCVCRPLNAN